MGKYCLFLILPILSLSGCVKTKKDQTSFAKQTSSKTSVFINYEYEDLGNRLVLWDDIPHLGHEHYFVYLFSRTCGHCQRIKNLMIPMIIEREFCYACETSNEHRICADPETGSFLEIDFCILGYPTMIEVKSGELIDFASGENEVLTFFNLKYSL